MTKSTKSRTRTALQLLPVVSVVACLPLSCEGWSQWDSIFERDSINTGFRASDGGNSIALPTVANGPATQRTVMMFGDTQIYNPATSTIGDVETLPGNSIAVFNHSGPSYQPPTQAELKFYVRNTAAPGNIVQLVAQRAGATPPTIQAWANNKLGASTDVLWPNGGGYVPSTGKLYMFWTELTDPLQPLPVPVAQRLYEISNPEADPLSWNVSGVFQPGTVGSNVSWGHAIAVDAGSNVWIYGMGPGTLEASTRIVLALATPSTITDYSKWQFLRPSPGGFEGCNAQNKFADGTVCPPTSLNQIRTVADVVGPQYNITSVTIDGISRAVLTYVQNRPPGNQFVVRFSDVPWYFPPETAGFPNVYIGDLESVFDRPIGKAAAALGHRFLVYSGQSHKQLSNIPGTTHNASVGELRIPRRIGEDRGGVTGAVHHSPVKIWAAMRPAA